MSDFERTLYQYSTFRANRADNLDVRLPFEMYFDSHRHPNVFFLDAALTHMVHAHLVLPYPRFVLALHAGDNKFQPPSWPAAYAACEEEIERGGLVLPWRSNPKLADIGCAFWTLYGDEASRTILFQGESAEDKFLNSKSSRCHTAALVGRKKGLRQVEPVEPLAAAPIRVHHFSYFPWQRFSWEEWRNANDGSTNGYRRLRQARVKTEGESKSRKLDKVLKKTITSMKMTTLKEMIEEDEWEISNQRRIDEWNSSLL